VPRSGFVLFRDFCHASLLLAIGGRYVRFDDLEYPPRKQREEGIVMSDARKTRSIETFLQNGGTFVVLRPIPEALTPERTVFSIAARVDIAHARKAAMQYNYVDLVLIPRGDKTAYVTVNDPRWPLPVFVDALALPRRGTRDGDLLAAGCTVYGNSPLESYLSNEVLGGILHSWVNAATTSIDQALSARMIRKGRVVICGGGPFTQLLAGDLLPSSTAFGSYWDGQIFQERVNEEEGFIVKLNRAGHAEIKPLFPRIAYIGNARRLR